MHGIVFSELQRYAETKHGPGTWKALLNKAGLDGKEYSSFAQYPDQEVAALVAAASSATGAAAAVVLEDFGEFIAPSLLSMYANLILPRWKTLDVIHETESTIHAIVRQRDKAADPPKLKTRRVSAEEVVLTYDSPRQMCALAKGIARGLAKHFKETILISEAQCMHHGASSCVISFQIVPERPSRAR
ncbi:MAG: heme NO-binding domain-containing protein [Candidatus Sulfotelmatobacter sp.]